jgi:hypothetical protein
MTFVKDLRFLPNGAKSTEDFLSINDFKSSKKQTLTSLEGIHGSIVELAGLPLSLFKPVSALSHKGWRHPGEIGSGLQDFIAKSKHKRFRSRVGVGRS